MLYSDNKYVAESSRSEKDKMWGSDWSDLMAGGLLLGPEDMQDLGNHRVGLSRQNSNMENCREGEAA